jgi:hypothetical protein
MANADRKAGVKVRVIEDSVGSPILALLEDRPYWQAGMARRAILLLLRAITSRLTAMNSVARVTLSYATMQHSVCGRAGVAF